MDYKEKINELLAVANERLALSDTFERQKQLLSEISCLKAEVYQEQKAIREIEKQLKDSEAEIAEGVLANKAYTNAEQRKNAIALEAAANGFYQELLAKKSEHADAVAEKERAMDLAVNRFKATGYEIEAAIAIIRAIGTN